APNAMRQAQKLGDRVGIVERAKTLSILGGQPSPAGRQARDNVLHPEQSQIVGLGPVPGDALEEGGDLGDLGRRLSLMAIEQEPQDQLETFKGDEIGYRTNRLRLDALVDEGGGGDAQLFFSGLEC